MGLQMWAAFSTTVKDVPGPSREGPRRKEGWVTTKKVCGSFKNTPEIESGHGDGAQNEHATINLNLPPGKHVQAAVVCADGRLPGCADTVGARKVVAKGGGRTTGRGRQPPVVAPRYHTSVVVPAPKKNKHSLNICFVLFLHDIASADEDVLSCVH